ncbi:MAG: hydroxymethylglutaryl-CoA lyase [Planctomycetota bacterium]|nr:hydroxymethylglutaryl-CoA lyase [Planctomycetota bacterium]
MPENVYITDVSPRDGLQNEPAPVATADKLRLINLLRAAAVDEIEATSFVSPKWIPQLADAEEVMKHLHEDAGGWGRRPVLSVLVPNEKGFQRARNFHSESSPLKIAVFTAASETFSRKNTNATIAETVERFAAFLPDAFSLGMKVRFYISCAVACPFEGPVDPAAVRRVADMLLELAPSDRRRAGDIELDLGDTIGAAAPADIDRLIDAFDEDHLRPLLVLHLHDTFGRAVDCVHRGLERGVRRFDGAAGGLGGCPYAGTKEKPAPGNIATEPLVATVRKAGFTTGVDESKLREAGAFASTLISAARANAKPYTQQT